MAVDVHTHIPTHRDSVPQDQVQYNTTMRPNHRIRMTNSFEDYVQAMAPVDRCFAFGIAPSPGSGRPSDVAGSRSQAEINDTASELARRYPDKVIGFMSVHPDDPGAMDELERCVGDLGLKGMKLGPNYQNFDPLGEPARRVFAYAERRGLPIVFHQGTSPVRNAPLRYAHPLVMDEVASDFPDLKIVMAHMGHPWHADCIVVVRKHPNVFADCSAQFSRPWSQYNGFRLAYEWDVTDKLLFASDWPVTTPAETMDGLRRFNELARRHNLPEVPDEVFEGIIGRDAVSLLGLA